MGSSGSSRFGDYKPSGKSKCGDSIDTDLDDPALSRFYTKNGGLPAKGSPVNLRSTPQNGRLVVEETKSSLAIGSLPTRFNYLLICMKEGHSYAGTVTVSRASRVPVVEVHLDPV